MNKQEFINDLERALRGAGASEAMIWDNINFYGNYFDTETAKGRSEQEIAAELGDARLIAKSILEAQEGESLGQRSESFEEGSGGYERADGYKQTDGANRGFQANYGEDGWDVRVGKFKVNSWYGYLLLALIVLAVLGVVFSIVAGILSLVLPVLLPVLIILLVLRYFSERK